MLFRSRINAIGPGFIETPLNEKVRATNPELAKTFIAHTPLGRAGSAEDIVGRQRCDCHAGDRRAVRDHDEALP